MKTSNHRDSIPVRHVIRAVALMSMLLFLHGCASLDKNECVAADWRLIGYHDGVAGKSPVAVGTYRKDCAKHAVVPDLDAYQAGRSEGLQEYCKAVNGYQLGNSGRGFSSVCPSHLEADFRAAYSRGRELYLARSAVKQTRSKLHKQQQALQHIGEDKSFMLSELISDGLRASERVQILYDISRLEKEKDSIENEIAILQDDLSDQQAYLDHLNRQASR
jgi:hypothetical protein